MLTMVEACPTIQRQSKGKNKTSSTLSGQLPTGVNSLILPRKPATVEHKRQSKAPQHLTFLLGPQFISIILDVLTCMLYA